MRVGMQLIFQNHQDYNDQEMYKNELRLIIEAEEMGYDISLASRAPFF